MDKPTFKFNPNYKQFREDFQTKPVHTRQEMADALAALRRSLIVNRVILEGKDYDIALNIIRIQETEEGVIVRVKT